MNDSRDMFLGLKKKTSLFRVKKKKPFSYFMKQSFLLSHCIKRLKLILNCISRKEYTNFDINHKFVVMYINIPCEINIKIQLLTFFINLR